MPQSEQNQIIYYSRMFQATPALAPLQYATGGMFISNRPSTLRAFRNIHPQLSTLRHHSRLKWTQGNTLLDKSRIIVSGAGYKDFLSKYSAKKLMVFHGTAARSPQGFISDLAAAFDHLFLIGSRMEAQFNRFKDRYNLSCSTIGYLPFSCFPEKTPANREQILRKLDLDPGKRTILYTSASIRSASLKGSWLDCAEDIARNAPTSFNLVMRPHPAQSLHGNKQVRNTFKTVNKILRERGSGILDLTICSLPELESVADLIISDANSPAEESLYYQTPQLFTGIPSCSKDAYRRLFDDSGMHREDTDAYLELFNCAPSFHGNFGSWPEAIEYAIEQSPDFSEKREDYFRWVFGSRQQNSVNQAVSHMESLLRD